MHLSIMAQKRREEGKVGFDYLAIMHIIPLLLATFSKSKIEPSHITNILIELLVNPSKYIEKQAVLCYNVVNDNK